MHELLPDVINSADSVDVYAPLETPIGRLFVAFNGALVTVVRRSVPAVEASLRARFDRPVRQVSELPEPLARAVAEHLRGVGRGTIAGDEPLRYTDPVAEHLGGEAQSTLQFDLGGLPAFDQSVLRTVLEIPHGQVRSYAWVAREIGQPRAAKDVGLALGQNPIPLLIPCHRVIYSDGRLGGYIFGGRAKRALLRAEGVELAESGLAA